ncbi:hypothetical protein MTO96_021694 [Rhipicephalus appendiculatus]
MMQVSCHVVVGDAAVGGRVLLKGWEKVRTRGRHHRFAHTCAARRGCKAELTGSRRPHRDGHRAIPAMQAPLVACKGFQVFEENQEKQVHRVHQGLKVKEDCREFQEKTEMRAKMAGPDQPAHLALWVKEDFLVCPDSQVSKDTGVSQALMELKESKVFKVKKGQRDHQEGQGHRDRLAQLDHEESEAETDRQVHR